MLRKRAHRLALLSLLYSLLPSVSVHRSCQTVDTTACMSQLINSVKQHIFVTICAMQY